MDLTADADDCNSAVDISALNLNTPDHEIAPIQEVARSRPSFSKANAVAWILREIDDAPEQELRTSLRKLGDMFVWGKTSVDTFLRSDLCTPFVVERGSHSINIKLRQEAGQAAGQQAGQAPESHVVRDNPADNPFRRPTDDFSWKEAEEDGDIVQPHCSRTAIYWNSARDIVIRAEQSWSEDEDPYIVLSPIHVPAVITRLFDMIGRPVDLLEKLTDHVPGVGRR